jgi:GT2 family glycosyltransferase
VASGDPCRPTVVVVTWQGAHLLPACLTSLRAQTLAHDVLVVDNASTDGTAELLAAEFPEVRVVMNARNTGLAGGVDTALRSTSASVVALLNNDAVAEPDWLAALATHLTRHPEAGAVTSRMLLAGHEPARLNNTGVLLRPDGYGADRGLGDDATAWGEPDEVFGFSGGAALLRRDALEQVGGFPAPFFLYYEDTDTSWRLRLAGRTVRYEPAAVVHHEHAASSDPSSALFAYFNERNRLLTLVRCAPATFAFACWARFLVTTASLAVTRLGRRPLPDAQQFRIGLRLRALGGAVRLLPWALRSRPRAARATRRRVLAEWAGTSAAPRP